MSNAIRFDALLLAALAHDLEETLRGARVRHAWIDRGARLLALELGEKRAPRTLTWNLHPTSGQLLIREGAAAAVGARLQVRPGSPIRTVRSVPDERVLRLELDAEDAAPGVVRGLVVELIGNRWNVLALAADDVIAAALIQRTDGARALRPGVAYQPPPPGHRLALAALPSAGEWSSVLAPVPPDERKRALLARFAWTSPLNAAYILGDATRSEAAPHVLEEARARYIELRNAPSRPHLLGGGQPYIHPLAGDALPCDTLLAAFDAAARVSPLPALGADALREAVRARLHERGERLRTRVRRLEAEAANAAREAEQQRALGALLLARLAEVPRGARTVELEDFSGERVAVPLDPALSAQQNAQRLYDRARRRERAAANTPQLLARAARELEWLEAARERLDAGVVSADELQRWAARTERPARIALLPYREYRTTSGLEVRVGRSAKANDALTSQHASPEDIWMHARDVGGAHVILRWGRRDANPPRADLEQAAVLAALHSRARTSGVVPVDWTRRKYVRKPRKAAPGLVLPERVATLFVAPDPAVEARLRVDDAADE